MSDGIEPNDLDDVIDLATRRSEAESDRMSMDEVRRIGAELDIAPDEIDEAAAQLHRQREAQRKASALKAVGTSHRRRLMLRAGATIVALVVVIAAWTTSRLSSAFNVVEERRAQVINVVERQRGVQARLEGRAPDREVDAEIAGAENRVRIERKRYDEAAADYNRVAGGFNARWVTIFSGHPKRVPMSMEVSW